jgi:hypothetical protein
MQKPVSSAHEPGCFREITFRCAWCRRSVNPGTRGALNGMHRQARKRSMRARMSGVNGTERQVSCDVCTRSIVARTRSPPPTLRTVISTLAEFAHILYGQTHDDTVVLSHHGEEVAFDVRQRYTGCLARNRRNRLSTPRCTSLRRVIEQHEVVRVRDDSCGIAMVKADKFLAFEGTARQVVGHVSTSIKNSPADGE